MAFQKQNVPSLSFVMFLAMAAFGSYLWSSGPLETSRPPTLGKSTLYQHSGQTIPARLWQDPFRIVYDSIRANKGRQPPLLEQTHLLENIEEQVAGSELLVLGVMVSTEVVAEAEERRRRRRYAVVSALGEAGYVPEDANHINVVLSDIQGGTYLPYEWFRAETEGKDGKVPKVLLVWLDASRFVDHPYRQFADMAEKLVPDRLDRNICSRMAKHMRFVILGPAGSGTLKSMVQQAKSGAIARIRELGVSGFHILSPFATMEESILYRGIAEEDRLDKLFSFANCNDKSTCLTFHRTIHTDGDLMLMLVVELSNRGIKPNKNHIVLISELDTAFGRALPLSFKNMFCGSEGNECAEKYIHTYSYLRGIDGIAPGTRDIGRSSAKSASGGAKNDPLQPQNAVSIRRPVGTGQFDYLHRLAGEIVALDQEWRKQDGKGIMAVGILGSDVYDKLLILRALRPKLLGVTFFTTDLDAQLLHPAEYNWTRNLIVASSFGLKLPPDWQGRILPFRDGYQTSVFYAARLALGLSRVNQLQREIEQATVYFPPLFEIGRQGVVRLKIAEESPAETRSDNIYTPLSPPGVEKNLWIPWVLVLVALGLVIFALRRFLNFATYHVLWLSLAVVVLAVVSALGIWLDQKEEPFMLFSGVSVWPSIMINAMALLLGLYFICDALIRLKHNYHELGKNYALQTKGVGGEVVSHAMTLHDRPEHSQAGKTRGWVVLFSLAALLSALLVGLLPYTITYANAYWMVVVWSLILTSWYALVKYVCPSATIRQWRRELSGKRENDVHIQDYWAEYGKYGLLHNRFLRAFSVVLVFQMFVSVIFTLFGLEPSPLRGDTTLMVDGVVNVLSVLSMMFLLFIMVDATRLCIVWILGLTHNEFDWRGSGAEAMGTSMHMSWGYAVHWIKLKMIAERTRAVSKLIYYPFIIIILMLVSRISYFDNWGFPQGLAIVTGAIVLIAVYTAFRLRQTAEKVREDAIEFLRQERVAVSGDKKVKNKPSKAQINELIANITDLKEGAFQPFLEQPVVKACLLLLAGIGFSASQFSAFLY